MIIIIIFYQDLKLNLTKYNILTYLMRKVREKIKPEALENIHSTEYASK